MRERAVEVLFKHKLLIFLPVLVIVPLSVMVAARPRPQNWQAFATIWIDQYKPLYSDERLLYTPAANTAQLIRNFLGTYSFASQVIESTSLAPMLEQPASRQEALN